MWTSAPLHGASRAGPALPQGDHRLGYSGERDVDANNGELIAWLFSPPAHDTQQGIVAHWHHQAIGKSCGRPAAQCQSQVMNDGLKASGSPR
jgi:hypothetical protein